MRDQFPILQNLIYFDNASAGAMPIAVAEAIKSFLDDCLLRGEDWQLVLKELEECRSLFADLLKAKPDNVATVPNASTGMAALFSSLSFRRGANLVLAEHNFPTSYHISVALKERGILSEIRIAPYDPSEETIQHFERLVDDQTAIVSVDAVGWLTGKMEDLREIGRIAHEHGALLFSDIFHAAGVIPMDLRKLNVDCAVCGMYKWLLGQQGLAFLYVSDEVLQLSSPMLMGWFSVEDSIIDRLECGESPFVRSFPLLEARPSRTARRFEWGSPANLSVISGAAALRLISSIDEGERYGEISRVAASLREKLLERGYSLYSPSEPRIQTGIVSVMVRDPTSIVERLRSRNIECSSRPGIVRFSPHFFNSVEEVERVVDALDECRGDRF